MSKKGIIKSDFIKRFVQDKDPNKNYEKSKKKKTTMKRLLPEYNLYSSYIYNI